MASKGAVMKGKSEQDVMGVRAANEASGARDELTADALRDATVHDRQGREVGRVRDVVLAGDGRVESVVLEIGGYLGVGSRTVAVATRHLAVREEGGSSRIMLGMTEDELRDLPDYRLPVAPPGVPPQPR
jgi:sporulation protein YlmC with PRC-barrel domain